MNKNIKKIASTLLFSNILIKSINFLTTPLFTRLLDPAEYGLFSSYLIYDTLFQIIISIASYSSFKNAMIQYEGEIKKYLGNIYCLISANFLVVYMAVNIFWMNNSVFNNGIIRLLVVTSFSNAIINIYYNYSYIKFEYKYYFYLTIINTILNLTLSIIFINNLTSGEKYLGRIYGYSLPSILIGSILLFKNIRVPKTFEHIIFAIKFSFPVQIYALSEFALSQVNRVIILNKVGQEELGFYSLAYTIYSIIAVIRNSFDTFLGPLIFKILSTNQIPYLESIIKHYLHLIEIVTISLIILAPEIITIYAPAAYRNSIYVAIPLITSSYIIAVISILIQLEYYKRKTTFLPIITIIFAIINTVMNLVLIEKYGYMISAIITVAMYLMIFVSHYIFVGKLYEKMVIKKNIFFRILLIFFVASSSLLLIDKMLIRIVVMFLYIIIEINYFRKYRHEIVYIINKDVI